MTSTAQVPLFRRLLLILDSILFLLSLLFLTWTLTFQLIETKGGFQRVLPFLLLISLVGLPTSIALLLVPLDKGPQWTTKLRCILSEVVVYGTIDAGLVMGTSVLHSETPGLLGHCGGYLNCRLLTACVSLSWLTFLSVSLHLALLLTSTLYFTLRRRLHLPHSSSSLAPGPVSWLKPFEMCDWAFYSPSSSSASLSSPRFTSTQRATSFANRLTQLVPLAHIDLSAPRSAPVNNNNNNSQIPPQESQEEKLWRWQREQELERGRREREEERGLEGVFVVDVDDGNGEMERGVGEAR
ncbi:hypothetical protein T439DRAFT_377454 [Meredithblackwellia eburnea MCA 4105]